MSAQNSAEILEISKACKVCNKCAMSKPVSDFGKAARNPNKLQSICKTCVAVRIRLWGEKNVEKNLKGVDSSKSQVCRTCEEVKTTDNFCRDVTSKTGFVYECSVCTRSRDRKRYRKDTEKRKQNAKWSAVKAKYGLTKDCWYRLLQSQQCACAICRKLFDDSRVPHTDHDHKTGDVRGLLCKKCNFAVGFLSDDPLIFDSGAKYLREHVKEET